MAKRSAGILLYRRKVGGIEVLLVHPGGPFWAKKDAGAWSIPKGEYGDAEEPLACALREFHEETGTRIGPERLIDLGSVKQRGGKIVTAWAAEGDLDAAEVRSNTFSIEWPPRSGRRQDFPEVDRAEWFKPGEAREKLLPAQTPLLDRLLAAIGPPPDEGAPDDGPYPKKAAAAS
jgi:predicted NUDIX family NTP pyrophosphohydrolase